MKDRGLSASAGPMTLGYNGGELKRVVPMLISKCVESVASKGQKCDSVINKSFSLHLKIR